MKCNITLEFSQGDHVKDQITGFQGHVLGTTIYITGCNQYLVSPKAKTNNLKPAGEWIDEDRLSLTNKKPITLKVNKKKPGADIPAPKI